MNTTLLLPVSGQSNRFPGTRPKWLLTHPSGNFMIVESIKKLNLTPFDKIIIIHLKEHVIYDFKQLLTKQFKDITDLPIIYYELDNSDSPVETIQQAILGLNIVGPVFIKDCDNQYECNFDFSCDFICVSRITNRKLNYLNKQYVRIENNKIVDINSGTETLTFSVGGYFFKNTATVINNTKSKNIIDIYNDLIENNTVVNFLITDKYEDWGTIEDWNLYRSKYKTLFIDIDGVLFKTSETLNNDLSNIKLNENNYRFIQYISKLDYIQIIFTTARTSETQHTIEKILTNLDIKFKLVITNLLHSNRIIINDYNSTNMYPTCQSINIKRDYDSLSELLII